ncbi:MAG: Mur ligase family protein [bacterium]
MKEILLKQLRKILRTLARLTIKKYNPWIVGITGSVGKTSTKSAIYQILKQNGNVRMAGGNLNNELGLPLAILGDYQKSGGSLFWVKVIFSAVWQLMVRQEYPDVLILEYGADRPGDIAYLLTIVRPNISVITAVGKIPVHIEFYEGSEGVAREKGKLVQGLRVNDAAVLNEDDLLVVEMKGKTRARIMTFGFTESADVKIVNFENRSENGRPKGISFKLEANGSFVPVKIDGIFGYAHAYAAAAAACVGLMKGVNLVKISEALSFYVGEPGRMSLVQGRDDTFIIDDTYNAAPLSMGAALDVLESISATRKITILGDMAELGKYSTYAHEDIGKKVGKIVDILVTVGGKGRLIGEGARKAGLKEDMIIKCKTSDEAIEKITALLQKGDLILVKGSQSMRMEKIVRGIMKEPERAPELLVRQYGKWISS